MNAPPRLGADPVDCLCRRSGLPRLRSSFERGAQHGGPRLVIRLLIDENLPPTLATKLDRPWLGLNHTRFGRP